MCFFSFPLAGALRAAGVFAGGQPAVAVERNRIPCRNERNLQPQDSRSSQPETDFVMAAPNAVHRINRRTRSTLHVCPSTPGNRSIPRKHPTSVSSILRWYRHA